VIGDRHLKSAIRAEVNAPWRDRVRCKGLGALMGDKNSVLEAKRVCWSCPVLFDCRMWVLGITTREDSMGDVTAALTYSERRSRRASERIRRKRAVLQAAEVTSG
jgi:hypothetical protein